MSLPDEVDNITSIYYPHWEDGEIYFYSQHQTSSCQSVSTIFSTYTFEVNRLRDLASNSQQTRYAPNFSWNHLNEGFCGYQGYTSLEVVHYYLQQAGAMCDFDFDGNANLDKFDCLRWPTGYDKYFNTLGNKLDFVNSLSLSPDGTGIETLKHYLYDHCTGITPVSGGIITFGARDYNNGSNISTLVAPSDHVNDQVRINMDYGSNHGHSVTIVGYNDNVMYDWGGALDQNGNVIGDGQFSNTTDNNLDGSINMADWEIGAVKIANSYGTDFGTN